MLYARISGIASYVPDDILDNEMLSKMVDTNDEWITTRVGIKERRILKKEGAGIDADECFADVARWCAMHHEEWELERLLKNGLHVSRENFTAMNACIEHGLTNAGKLLLDRGMNFDEFCAWAQRQPQREQNMETLNDLREYWRERQEAQSQANTPESQKTPENGGMVLG